jgi:hypothetical protein
MIPDDSGPVHAAAVASSSFSILFRSPLMTRIVRATLEGILPLLIIDGVFFFKG